MLNSIAYFSIYVFKAKSELFSNELTVYFCALNSNEKRVVVYSFIVLFLQGL